MDTVHAYSAGLRFLSWPTDAVCASPQSPQMQVTQSTVNEQRSWNVGRERYDVRKNKTFKMLQESRHNSNKEQVRECTHVVKIPGRSIAFVISKKLGTGYIQCVPLFIYNTQRWSVTLQISKETCALLHTKRSYVISCKSARGISSCYVWNGIAKATGAFCNSATKEAELRIAIKWDDREHIGDKRKSTLSDTP